MPVPVLGPVQWAEVAAEAGRGLRRVRSLGGPWASDSTAPGDPSVCDQSEDRSAARTGTAGVTLGRGVVLGCAPEAPSGPDIRVSDPPAQGAGTTRLRVAGEITRRVGVRKARGSTGAAANYSRRWLVRGALQSDIRMA